MRRFLARKTWLALAATVALLGLAAPPADAQVAPLLNILPNRTCSITVRFVPTEVGVREAEPRIFDAGGAGPVVLLHGAGH